MSEILKITDVSKAFGGVQALKKVSLRINKGEIHCLAGGNGSGKSTLIKIVSGYYKPDGGMIELNGRNYDKLTPIEAIREGSAGYIPGFFCLSQPDCGGEHCH